MLDGAARLDDLFDEAARLGMPALAMTDHGNVFGAYDFYKAQRPPASSRSSASRPTSRRRRRFERRRSTSAAGSTRARPRTTSPGGGAYTHMTMLGREQRGHAQPVPALLPGQPRGLLLQAAHGPRAARRRYGKGMIATTGCPSGEVNRWLRRATTTRALAAAADFRDIFGAGNYFCELMDHGLADRAPRSATTSCASPRPRPPAGRHQRPALHARRTTPTPTTCCCACTRTTHGRPQALQVRRATTSTSRPPRRCATSGRELPEACDNTLLIAERCDVAFTEGANLMPRFPVPTGETEESWLVKEVERGLQQRFPARRPRRRPRRRPSTRSASSARWASPATSSSPPTSSATPRRAASGSARAAARPPARSSPTRWASPTSTRSSTACSSSASSTPSASRCPTSTSTSTSAAAAT